MAETLLTSTAPIFEVDGDIRGELARDVIRLEIEETTSGLKTLKVRLLAQGPVLGAAREQQLYLDGATIDFGKKLTISLGSGDQARTVFKGWISGLEADFQEGQEPEVVIFAEDQLMSLRMTHRIKTYRDMADGQIAEFIASEHGLAAQTDADGPTYDVVQQWNMSDLAFLRERASLLQAEIWIQDDTLHFKTRDKRAATHLTLVQGNHIVAVQIRADLAHQRTGIHVSGYDARGRESIEEEAGSDTIQTEVPSGRTGPTILKQALGERIAYRLREVPLTDEEARAWARSEMLRRARQFVTVAGTTRGTPDLMVGSSLTLEQVGQPFDGSGYYVTRVCHTYDLDNGYRTRFEAERPSVQEGV